MPGTPARRTEILRDSRAVRQLTCPAGSGSVTYEANGATTVLTSWKPLAVAIAVRFVMNRAANSAAVMSARGRLADDQSHCRNGAANLTSFALYVTDSCPEYPVSGRVENASRTPSKNSLPCWSAADQRRAECPR